jgi:PAS domain S-box-containing protein
MIHTIDNDGKLIWANRSWKEKLGLKGQKIEGLALSRFLDSRTLEEFQRIMPLLSEGETATNLDCVFISTEGRSLNLEGRAIPIFEGPEVIGSQAYLHDITSIRKAENDLKQLLELTRRQNERLRNFTHIVSHNLRSHSSNLSGLIHLLRLEIPDIQNNIFYDNFNVAINNLMEVIQQLSEVALIHTEEDKEFEAVDLSEAIEKAIATVFGLARNAGVEIRNRIEGKSLVLGDPGYIDSIILNLLTNAIKYKSETRESFVEITAGSATDSFFCLEVRDNGLGIDLDRQGRKIFGMYKTFHKHQDARGVGLFMTKNQVEAMGGRIEVQSKIDEGTVFSVFLKSVAYKSS